ncbi:hypothetical protein ACWC5I_22585 [Kitasatospora sp. NPDC001574]
MLVVLPLVLLGAAVGLLFWADAEFRHPKPDSGRPGAWTTTTSEEVARFAHVEVPGSAADVRWGYQLGFQDDLAALAFRIPQAEVDAFLASLPVPAWKESRHVAAIDLDNLLHIGAPDPSSMFPLTCGDYYSPGGGKRIGTTVCLAPWPDGTRQVWVTAAHFP